MTRAFPHRALLLATVCFCACEAQAGGALTRGPGGSTPRTGPGAPHESAPALSPDTCGNGLDDNGNGAVDEGCGCAPGATQSCYAGPAETRAKGVCRDGVQECRLEGEFPQWGPCHGAVIPIGEIAANGADDDCDGAADEDAPGGSSGGTPCLPSEFGAACGDASDGDCDGLVDCDDPDCASAAACASCAVLEFSCADGVDEDCDGAVDCSDVDCSIVCNPGMPPPPPGDDDRCVEVEFRCDDGLDEDCDGSADCDDADCGATFFCGCIPFELICGDGRDDDCDGAADCADSECVRAGSCGCSWGESSCADGRDDDCDGSVDCNDAECEDDLACRRCEPFEWRCADGADDDCDGLVDCADDYDCAAATECMAPPPPPPPPEDGCEVGFVCVPGTERWCDTPTYCRWGISVCMPDGRWGSCVETSDRPGSCGGTYYSTECCLAAGGCCQDYPLHPSESLGDCFGITCG
ncbi:MAG: hypothetical protein IT379_31080 [Deltaproteobacteria bacterium]|nr:hypothetical protein [Deltaproteobacteria bacterium]